MKSVVTFKGTLRDGSGLCILGKQAAVSSPARPPGYAPKFLLAISTVLGRYTFSENRFQLCSKTVKTKTKAPHHTEGT